ncbi:MAG: flagellar basal body P-ring formation chaperone FlgA [Ignavibacteria bacterium]|nr:flagellar basal body P-ring formation chaperone FlgA [Ignavibacteria bacterium]
MMLYLLNIIILFSLNGNEFRDELKDYLTRQLTMYDSFDYEIMQMPKDYSSISIEQGTALNLNRNIVSVPVLLVKENKKSESLVKVKLHLYKKVVTVRNKIESKTDLNSSEFDLKTLDVSLLKGTPFFSLDEVSSFRTKIKLNSGSILIHEALEAKPVIKSGDLVKASLTNGNVTITIEANARQEGAVGDLIRVVTQNKKQYRAKVVDQTNVNILE